MAYHDWSEKGFDWKGLDEAGYMIQSFCKRWGRLGGMYKEKFGRLRFYANFGWISLHTLIYPGYVYNQFPGWLWRLDLYCISPVLQFLFENIFDNWQRKIYNMAYRRAVLKYPHLREEILEHADYPELLMDISESGKYE